MENNNSDPFNRYENHLSVFGRKVLNTLRQKWISDQNDRQISRLEHQHHINSSGKRKALTIRSNETISQIPTPPMICHLINTGNDLDAYHFDSNLGPNFHDQNNIPTTKQPFQAIDTTDKEKVRIGEDTDVLHDFINPVVEGCIPSDIGHIDKDIQIKISNVCDLSDTLNSTDKREVGRSDGVGWDNMFDTELFSAEAAISNAQPKLEQIDNTVLNNFSIQFPCKPKKTSESKMKADRDQVNETNDIEIIKTKRINQPITDAIPKKVKKIGEEPNISFRKQKYTKSVKNWLNDVNANNTVHRDEDIEKNVTEVQAKVIVEKTKGKQNKKIVQAQLANKDGVMKFRKPITETTKKLETDSNDVITAVDKNELVEKLETPEKNKVNKMKKHKMPEDNKSDSNMNQVTKNKPKFVAPIKSQIPIKDMTYQVVTLEGNNINDYTETLNCIENQEILLVLIYSNGFCQLNYHYKEDICEPEGFIVYLDDIFFYFKRSHQNYKEILQPLLEKNKIVCYEGKNLLKYFKSLFDLDVYGFNIIDVEIGGSILKPDNPPANFSELQKLLSFTPQFKIATECLLQKTAWYATLLKDCASKLVKILMEEQLWNVFTNIEMKLLPIIAEMERHGVSVDLQKLKSMEDILLSKMKWTESECHKAAGKTFQINSPVQVRTLIYDELKLDTKCNMKIRETVAQGAKSTSEEMLRGLVSVHPLPRLVLEYRHLHKAHATFLTGIAQHVKDGIVRPTWVQTAAATGRIASNNPNLQAIPKAPFSLVLFPELAEADNSARETLSFRSVYTCGGGRSLLACDFKHVECRVFAHAAADDALLAALRTDTDLFRVLAHKWLQKPEGAVSAEERERTKRIVYASLYGAGARRLMDILGVGYEQALAVLASFNSTFPCLKSFGQSVVSRCEESGGWLGTLCGRRRRFRNIASRDYVLRAQAERQAVNFIIQGSAADLCKLAMVSACARLRQHAPPLDARLLLQIHDELVWDVRDEHLHAAAVIVKQAMENCGLQSGMEDTLPVAVSVGKNWGEMTEYHVD